MKAVLFNELGGAEVLGVGECDKPEPQAGQVLIKVASSGLNRADVLFHKGKYYKKPVFPSRTGKEAAGVVEAVGDGVSFQVGDRVGVLASTLDESTQGCIAEYVCAPQEVVIRTPKSVSDEDAGGIWMQYFTAYGALNHVTHVGPGQYVVITAASSSVGIAAIQLCNLFGAVPIATTTSPHKVDRLKELGATHVVDTKNENYVDRVMDITDKKGADVVFDAVAGAMVADHITVCKPMGWILIYGVLDTSPMNISAGILVGTNAAIRGYSIRALYQDTAATAEAVKTISEGLDSGKLDLIDKRFPMADIQDAQRYMESNQQIGKIIINP